MCGECGKLAERSYADEGFFAQGGTNFEVQKAAMHAMAKADIGGQLAPVFKDENGKVHEVRNSKDLDRWTKDNQLGVPRMVEWTNRVNGKKSMVPQQTVMRAGPDGEPLDLGAVVRSSEHMIPLDGGAEPPMREVDAFGNRMVNGVRKTNPKDVKLKAVDPATGRPINFSDLWTGSGGGPTGFVGGEKARGAMLE